MRSACDSHWTGADPAMPRALDHATAGIRIEQALLRAFHGRTQAAVGEPLSPRETRQQFGSVNWRTTP